MIDPVFAISIILFLAGSALLFIRLHYIRQNSSHSDDRSRRVHEAADELNRATNDLRNVVKGISESPDPLRELINSMQQRDGRRHERGRQHYD